MLKIYMIIINIISLILYGIDKHKAKKNKYRISEFTLIIISYLGGAIGAILGMNLFHHKTKKPKFKILIPISLMIWIYIIVKVGI